MKIQWCWRCKKDVPMLDEEEWAVVRRLRVETLRAYKQLEESRGLADAREAFDRRNGLLGETLNHITGETNEYPYACINHAHRIAERGGPCARCGKVLRTPNAVQCFECGWHGRAADIAGPP